MITSGLFKLPTLQMGKLSLGERRERASLTIKEVHSTAPTLPQSDPTGQITVSQDGQR